MTLVPFTDCCLLLGIPWDRYTPRAGHAPGSDSAARARMALGRALEPSTRTAPIPLLPASRPLAVLLPLPTPVAVTTLFPHQLQPNPLGLVPVLVLFLSSNTGPTAVTWPFVPRRACFPWSLIPLSGLTGFLP